MKANFTRAEVISIIGDILERADDVINAITSESPDYDAEDFLNMAEDDLFPGYTTSQKSEGGAS